MFAIVKLGNQQFKVKAGDFIRAPFQDHSVNANIDIPVLAFGDEKNFVFDDSKLKGSQVKAVVLRQSLGKKVLVFKKKRRKGYRRTRGHRQKITELQVLTLRSPEGKVSEFKRSAKPLERDKKTVSSKKTTSSLKKTSDKKASQKQTKSPEAKQTKSKNPSDKKVQTTKDNKKT